MLNERFQDYYNMIHTNPKYPGFEAEVICDSISPAMKRISSLRCRFPRFILAEVNTHRALSRNSASSRAIPVKKFLEQVRSEPYIPVFWGKNQKGMQSGEDLSIEERVVAEKVWLETRDFVVRQVEKLGLDDIWVDKNGKIVDEKLPLSRFPLPGETIGDVLAEQGRYNSDSHHNLNVHKETANRLLEPFMWHTALITATEWANFFALRTHPKASPAFRIIAELMADAIIHSDPKSLEVGEWHLPYADDKFTRTETKIYLNASDDSNSVFGSAIINGVLLMISAGRCARVSYMTQDGKRDVSQDVRLHNDLVLRQGDPSLDPAHGSPLEHQAQAMSQAKFPSGNFKGYLQYRKTIEHECIEAFTYKGFRFGWQGDTIEY